MTVETLSTTNVPDQFSDRLYDGSEYVLPEQSTAAATAVGFKNSLRDAHETAIQVVDFDDIIAQSYDRGDKTLSQGCIDIIKAHVKNAPHFSFYTHDPAMAVRVERLPQTLIARTSIAETSAHEVFFALLSNDDDDRMRVAVKSFHGEPEKAITDWTNTMLARKSGLDTFPPVGFMISNGVGYTVTERQDDIDPLDNVDWTKVLMLPDQYKNMLDDLCKVGPALARLHHGGIYHGDTQLKNGVLTQRGSVHWIDWEAATLISRSTPPSDSLKDLLHHKTTRDLKVLFGSLARSVEAKGVGLLHRQTPLAQWQHFDELILTPYFAERIKLLDTATPEQAEMAFNVMQAAEDEIAAYIKNGDMYATLQRSRHSA